MKLGIRAHDILLRRLWTILLIGLKCSNAIGSSGVNCREIFHSTVAGLTAGIEEDHEITLISYLASLLAENQINETHLRRMKTALTIGRLENPISAIEAQMSAIKNLQSQTIQKIIYENKIKTGLLYDWLDQAIAKVEIDSSRRSIIQQDTESIFAPLRFFVVPPGTVEFEYEIEHNKLDSRKFELTEWIEVSVTPITQYQWFEVMGANPSKFAGFNDTMPFTVNGKHALLEPDYPVENLTWWSAVVFANELSRARGFDLAYDLRSFDFREIIAMRSAPVVRWGRHTDIIMSAAASGRLDAQSNSNFTMSRMEGNEIYKSRGYRLPTFAEMFYLTKFYASLPPKPSLEVIGNVRVWLQDSGFSYNGLQAKNPVYWSRTYKYGEPRKIWPFTFAKILKDLTPPHIGYDNSSVVSNLRRPDIGLILVRSIPPPDGGTSAR